MFAAIDFSISLAFGIFCILAGIGAIVFFIWLFFFILALIYELLDWFWKLNQPYDKEYQNNPVSWLQVKNATKIYLCWLRGKKASQ